MRPAARVVMAEPGPGAGLVGDGASVAFNVPAALDGERLDRGLSLLVGASRSQVARLVSAGLARVGGRTVTTGSRRLRAGEVVELSVPAGPAGMATLLEEAISAPPEPGAPGPGVPEDANGLWAVVVYEDEDLVVVDKPAGLVVHPGAGNPTGTLVDQLVARFPDMAAAGPAGRAGVVHRLDKGTSGLLVVARTAAAREGLVAQMAARSARRRYLAVAHGLVEADEGLVDAPLGRSPAQRLKMAVVEGGRQARTGYRVLGRSSRPVPVTLLACRLETGRTHQVRAHLAAIGHPLAGDDRYGRAGLARPLAVVLPELSRPWLHAAELGFVHPLSGEPLHFSSPLPLELARTLPVLGLPAPPAELP